MFNVGGMELIVIALVALVVLGPDKLPGAIRQFGQVVGELRRVSRGFQTDLRGALDEAERDAAAAQKADAAGPAPDNHDPGAAQAVAQAELAAIEGAREASEASDASSGVTSAPDAAGTTDPSPSDSSASSTDGVGSEGSSMSSEPPRTATPGGGRSGPAS